MTAKSYVVTTVLVLSCFALGFLAFQYLEPSKVSSLAQQDAPATSESAEFDVQGRNHDRRTQVFNPRRYTKEPKEVKHHGKGKAGGKPHENNPQPVRAPAPVKAGSTTCFTVNTASLNVRSSPCGSVKSTISQGAKVTGVGTSATKSGCSLGATLKWQQISSPVSGYVADTYLVATSCSTTPPPSTGSGDLTVDQLVAVMPGCSRSKAQSYLPYLNSAMRAGGITSRVRQAAFLAQVGHESASLVYMEEIASGAAYEGRKDLGNTHPGDGKKYKGRGPIQITGRANYAAAGSALGLDLINNPAQAATPQVGFRLAVWFWNRAGLSSYADQNTQSAFDTITRRINGGTNGKADRDKRWKNAKKVFGIN